ncbi:hypothetical protein VB005_05798 [Metarhizium brunneum]
MAAVLDVSASSCASKLHRRVVRHPGYQVAMLHAEHKLRAVAWHSVAPWEPFCDQGNELVLSTEHHKEDSITRSMTMSIVYTPAFDRSAV